MKEGIVHMNVNEILMRIERYKLSDAPMEVKDREITKLLDIPDSLVVNGDLEDYEEA